MTTPMLAAAAYAGAYAVAVALAGQACEDGRGGPAHAAYRAFAAPLALAAGPARLFAALARLSARTHNRRSWAVPALFAALYGLTLCLQRLALSGGARVPRGLSGALVGTDAAVFVIYAVLLRREPSLPGGPAHYEYDGVLYFPDACERCERAKPPRTSHCAVCGRCVERKDHHCTWINRCVGRRNYAWFVAFLLAATTLAALTSLTGYLAWRRGGGWVRAANALFYALLATIGATQCGVHLRHLARNRTLNEGAKALYAADAVAARRAGVYVLANALPADPESDNAKAVLRALRGIRGHCVIHLPYNAKRRELDDMGRRYVLIEGETAVAVARDYNFYDRGLAGNLWEVLRAGLERGPPAGKRPLPDGSE